MESWSNYSLVHVSKLNHYHLNGANQSLPPSDINYFHCNRIIEILKQTEADTKNVFGRYGSQRMKDWQDVVKSYERDNAYLGEAAQVGIH